MGLEWEEEEEGKREKGKERQLSTQWQVLAWQRGVVCPKHSQEIGGDPRIREGLENRRRALGSANSHTEQL